MTKKREGKRRVRSPILEHVPISRSSKVKGRGRRKTGGATDSIALVRQPRAKRSQRLKRRKTKARFLEKPEIQWNWE